VSQDSAALRAREDQIAQKIALPRGRGQIVSADFLCIPKRNGRSYGSANLGADATMVRLRESKLAKREYTCKCNANSALEDIVLGALMIESTGHGTPGNVAAAVARVDLDRH